MKPLPDQIIRILGWIGKSSPLIAMVCLSILAWSGIISQWQLHENSIFVYHQSIIRIPWDQEQYSKSEISAELKIVRFNIQDAELQTELSIWGPRAIPDGFSGVTYKAVHIRYTGLASSEYDFSEQHIVIHPDEFHTDTTENISYATSILIDYPLPIPIRAEGFFPYEVHTGDISMWIDAEYRKENGQAEVRSVPLLIEIDNWVKDYTISIEGQISSIENYYPAESVTASQVNLTIQQQSFRKIFFGLILAAFSLFILMLLFVKDLPTMLQVLIALSIGVWGLSNILLPEEIPYSLRYLSELSILCLYILMGTAVYLWACGRWIDKLSKKHESHSQPNLPGEQSAKVRIGLDYDQFIDLMQAEKMSSGRIMLEVLAAGNQEGLLSRCRAGTPLVVQLGDFEGRLGVLKLVTPTGHTLGMVTNHLGESIQYRDFQEYLVRYLHTSQFPVYWIGNLSQGDSSPSKKRFACECRFSGDGEILNLPAQKVRIKRHVRRGTSRRRRFARKVLE